MINSHDTQKIVPIILAGGIGARLWPLSRSTHPKPFIKLKDGQSLIQKTYLRACDFASDIITVTNRDLFFYIKDEYDEVKNDTIFNSFLLEPCGRNSSAAIAMAAHYAHKHYGKQSILLILPADHLITQQQQFIKEVRKAKNLAAQGALVTFGIKPDSPKTGYGYIEADGDTVTRFIEKPTHDKAAHYLAAGNYFWNAGIFCMTIQTLFEEMNEFCPDILNDTAQCFTNSELCQSKGWHQMEFSEAHFAKVKNISIDYALFEKSKRIKIVPCDIGWSDIGSWNELGKLYDKDKDGNHITGETMLEEVHDSVIHAEHRLVAAIGVENLIIADTQDALLIAGKDKAQDVKKIAERLKELNHGSYQFFPTVHRPWGCYTVLVAGEGFKVKTIEVKPFASLSLQAHHHRSEHWVVVRGIAQVTNGDEIFELKKNQSTYIPIGNKHRLRNPTAEPLILTEVQCGDYLEEDDIVRFDDDYGR